MTTDKPIADERVERTGHRTIALVFDFDETLAPNTTDALLRHVGRDPDQFRTERVQPLVEKGWAQRLAEAHCLLEASRSDTPITREVFAEVAGSLELYPGVREMFGAVRTAVGEIEQGLDVEFHLITAGFVHIPEATAIAGEFTSIRGGHWAFTDDGAILFPMDTLGHYDKVRHLKAIAKGLDSVESEQSYDVNRDIGTEDWHVPHEQLIFVGDGDSDLPSYELMAQTAGMSFAVHQAESAEEWESRPYMRRGRKVTAVHRSDYSAGSPLLSGLLDAARRAALFARITLDDS